MKPPNCDMLEKLQELVESNKLCVLHRVIKHHPALYKWINDETSGITGPTLSEKVWYLLLGKPNITCAHGNQKKFKLQEKAYGYCGNPAVCKCFKEHVVNSNQSRDESQVTEKRKQTVLQKFGVDNIAKLPGVIKKAQSTKKEGYAKKKYDLVFYNQQTSGFNKVVKRVSPSVLPVFDRNEYNGCFRKNSYLWECITCNSQFTDHVDYGHIPRCPACYPQQISNGEREIGEFLTQLGVNFNTNNRELLNGKEEDIYIPSANLAIEFNGVYWYSSKFRDKLSHIDKYLKCKDLGIHLIQIFDDDWDNKKEIIKSRLKSALNINGRVYARKTKLSLISASEYKRFTTQHHLQGYASTSICYGLYYNDQLVAVMGFSNSRYHDAEFELIRYCSIDNVVGGASKLFSAFVKDYSPTTIVSYANRCWSNGNLYRKLGFNDITKNQRNVSYWYIRGRKRFHRSTFTKKRLVELGNDPSLTEFEIMDQLGYLRVYDCGNYKFLWTNSTAMVGKVDRK